MVKYNFALDFTVAGKITLTLTESTHGISQDHAESVINSYIAKAKARGFKFVVIFN